MTKENKTLFEKLGRTYSLGADGRYYPNIIVETKEEPIGKYGLLRKYCNYADNNKVRM